MNKVCGTCDHFPQDNHCLGCLYDPVIGGNNKWELRTDPDVIERKVIEDIKVDIDNQYKWLMQTKHTLSDIDIAFDAIKQPVDRHISGKEQE